MSDVLFLDLGPFGGLRGVHPPNAVDAFWNDHGLALMRTILHNAGVKTDAASVRLCGGWGDLWPQLMDYETLIMNVRSYRFGPAKIVARTFKELNPGGVVLVGGMHASVAPEEMEAVEEFDHICKGPGEKVIVDLVRNPGDFPKIFDGPPSLRMEDWPRMDRTLWPAAVEPSPQAKTHPLEASCGWGPAPVATIITSRVCPWRCSFCNEASYVPQMERRSVDSVIDELNWLDTSYGPLGSVVFHDSLIAGTRVFVPGTGIVRIEDLKPKRLLSLGNDQRMGELGLPLCSDDGVKRASYWTDEGEAETLEIKLRNGLGLTMTAGHKIRVVRDGQYVWERADGLRVGDSVPVQSGMEAWGQYQTVRASYVQVQGGISKAGHSTRWSRRRRIRRVLDERFAWLLGFFIGDGTQSARRSSWFLSWACNRPELADRVQRECKRIFRKRTGRHWQPPEERKLEIVTLHSRLIVTLFQEIMGEVGEGKRKRLAVPEVIFRSPRSVAEAFVRGLWDADGYRAIGGQSESISTISEELAQGVALLQLNCGLNPVIYKKNQGRQSKGYQSHPVNYCVYLHKTRDSVPVTQDLLRRYPSGSPSYRKMASGDTQPTLSRTRLQLLEPEHDLLARAQFYVPILAIAAAPRQRVYDVTVPDGESFVANGVISHNSMFFQQPHWIKEFIAKYPAKAHKPWPYWAAGRADTVHKWPDLYEALIRETNWSTISIGFESGSDQVLETLNKECTAEDNAFTIDLTNRIGEDMQRQGKTRPRFWANIIFAVPGETKEQAFKTIKMLRRMVNPIPSLAYYAPYAGSALGYQLIAEGKSLMDKDDHQRYAGQPKVKGVDYEFYADLLGGRYEREVEAAVFP